MATNGDLKTAVILSGGGAHGAYEVGVMLALCKGESPSTGDRPLNADIFCGTSVGAFNAAFMVSNEQADMAQTAESLEEVWLEQIALNPGKCGNGVYRLRDGSDWRDPRCLLSDPLGALARTLEDSAVLSRQLASDAFRLFGSGVPQPQRFLEVFDLSSYISVQPLRELIERNIELDRIGRSRKQLLIVTADWVQGKVQIHRNSELAGPAGHSVIHASAAIPGFFQPVQVREGFHVDGGLIMNTPLMPAIEAGAAVFHMIYLDPDPKNIPLPKEQGTLDTIDRLMHIQFAINIREDIATADRINKGLDLLEKASRNQALQEAEHRSLIRVVGKFAQRALHASPYRKLTVHRYFPRLDFPGGLLGYVDFDRQRLEKTMRKGWDDAVEHDCDLNGCLLPERQASPTGTAKKKA